MTSNITTKIRRTRIRLAHGLTAVLLGLGTFLFSGCDKDDPDPVNENELITTITLSFVKIDLDGNPVGEPLLFSWKDMDGSGPGAPVIDGIVLEAESRYELSITVLDESKTPVDDITAEIIEEKEEHQFFFEWSAVSAETAYLDEDDNGNPVGLKSLVTTGAIASGSLTIILIHEPDKDAAGVADGDPSNAGGETDVETEFPVAFQ